MKLIQKRPGELFLAIFVAAGLAFTVLATVGEAVAGKAGRGFDDGIINGSGWVAEEN